MLTGAARALGEIGSPRSQSQLFTEYQHLRGRFGKVNLGVETCTNKTNVGMRVCSRI